ncbi:MAG: PEP-CTERM sorting domain-containing protein [Planctomycetota bacterium]
MKSWSHAALTTTAALSCTALSSRAQLEITMDYTSFLAGPSGDVSTILNGASLNDAIAVMDHAAAIWEDVFANAYSNLGWANNGVISQTINVTWADQPDNVLATGGTSWFEPGFAFGTGSINWDGDNSSTFFVDPTPADNSEWRQTSERSQTLGGVSVNIERVSYDASSSSVFDNSDMLSVALHEMSHAIGFLGGYPLYSAADAGGDSDIDITSGAFDGAEIPIKPLDRSHTDFSIGSPGNDAKGTGRSDFPYDPGTNSWFNNSTYNPTVMSPILLSGVRYGLTEADILVAAEYLDFDMATVNFDPLSLTLGDMNDDGLLSNDDINAFVQALTDEPGYAASFASVDPGVRGDFSGDGVFDNLDIFGFVSALSGGGALTAEQITLFEEAGLTGVPEPTSLALLALGGTLLLNRRRQRVASNQKSLRLTSSSTCSAT